jgi:hypothetical protein
MVQPAYQKPVMPGALATGNAAGAASPSFITACTRFKV